MRKVLVAALIGLTLCGSTSAVERGESVAGGWAGLSLANALERLRAMGCNPIYSSELVLPEMRVETEPLGGSPRAIMDELLASHGLAVTEGSNGVMLIGLASGITHFGTLTGTVVAMDTGLPLSGAVVQIDGSESACSTGGDGQCEIANIPTGVAEISVSALGFLTVESTSVAVVEGSTAEVKFELLPQPRFLREVVVTPSRYGLLEQGVGSSAFLNHEEVRRTPHLSDDVFRVIHRVPGAVAGDLSSAFGLRGSAPEELKVIFEGLHIEEPFHLREFHSLLSMIDSEVVDGVEVLSSGYPVEHGDRMGGVLDIRTTVPNGLSRSLGSSILATRFSAENTTHEGRGSWQLSLRHSSLHWAFWWYDLTDEQLDLLSAPTYYDLFASWRVPIGKKNQLATHVLGAKDSFHFLDSDQTEDARVSSSSLYVWANLDSCWLPKTHTRTTVSSSQVFSQLDGYSESVGENYTEAVYEREYSSYGLKQDWVFEPSQSHLLKWGFEARQVEASYELDSYSEITDPLWLNSGADPITTIQIDKTPSGRQLGFYVADRFRLLQNLTAEVGLRWDQQSWTPGDDQLSPRFNLVWELGTFGTVRASWGRFAQAQGIHELQVEDGIDTFFPAQWAEHRVLSFESAIPNTMTFRIDAYRKIMSDLRPRFENLFEPVEIFPAGEPDRVRIDSEGAEAEGIELIFKSLRPGKVAWWFGLTFASVEDLVDGVWQPRSWDQRNAVSFSVNWRPGSNWNLNLSGIYHSGWPRTPAEEVWVQRPDGSWHEVIVVGERNTARYPAYRRLDFRASREHKLKNSTLRYFIEITNLLSHDNVRSTKQVSFWQTGLGNIDSTTDYDHWMPVLPSIGIMWEF
ncbi:MAG: TonB-dependent receptor [bacterium]|nr:TonB-dependent receptor [bacterium]